MKKLAIIVCMGLLIIAFQACLDEEPKVESETLLAIEMTNIPESFDYSTTKDVQVSLTVPDNLTGAVFSLIAYRVNVDSLEMAKATFDDDGTFTSSYTVPSYSDSIMVRSEYLGLVDGITIAIENGKAQFDYRPLYEGSTKSVSLENAVMLKSASADGYTYMGAYDSQGVPSYLTTPDNIEQNLLDDINASLPEYKKVPDEHPEYIASGTQTNIVITKTADVWVTFVCEGAGYKNTLGYYTYKVGDEPKSVDEIEQLNIVFPNASAKGAGGGLVTGDKVKLGRFDAGTVIAWFLIADGWSKNQVGDGRDILFSQPDLNPESDPNLQTHMVMLWDKSRETFLFGFEDILRHYGGCDQDFNDLVFYASSNPVDAIEQTNVQSIEAANDSDGDGINDELDDFPYDPNKSFNNYSPSNAQNGTVAFEDLWPSKGDYDFNDLVVNYKFNTIANSSNEISAIEADFTIQHIGGSFQNGFAFVLPISSSDIESVENQVMNVGFVSLNSNGTEAGVSETVIFVAENTSKLKGETISIIINLKNPVTKSSLGSPPYDPFIVVDGDRSREVHMPDIAPTSKGQKYLGQSDDYSNVGQSRYYKTDRNLPWALNIYAGYTVPPERVTIDKVYPKFVTWANSGGTEELEWYK